MGSDRYMKIIFHEDFKRADYASDGASVPGRMESIITILKDEGGYQFVSPERASTKDISYVHPYTYIDRIKKDVGLFNMASLSAGGAILAAEYAIAEEPAFACIRPPGHHASRNSGWGYCVFSNMAIALTRLKEKGMINSAFVLDFDAHKGDGTINSLKGWNEVFILNPMADDNKEYITLIEHYTKKIPYVDIVGICAGFDSYKEDMGKKLTTFDFYLIGRLMREFTKKMGHSRRFAILEGGYYLPVLGKNVLSFCQGFEELKLK